jgi:hypothetical protein
MEEAMPKTPAAPAAATPVPATTKARKQLADGIYLGLPNDDYHADDALGSSNLRDLLKGANLYWHKSRMNPKRTPDKKTEAKIVGNATHRLLLDGKELYEAEYVRGPYGPNDDHLSGPEKGALTKAAKKTLLEGQELLSQEDYDFVVGCKAVLDQDPQLQGCLDNGLSEVSVFWTRKDGVRCKARLDKLKIRGIGDIKTIANERERPLDEACYFDFSTYRYDIPSAHYIEGRRQMAALFHADKVFVPNEDGGFDKIAPYTDDSPSEQEKVLDFLLKCINVKNFGFQLVFIPKKGAPDAWSTVLSPGNPILDGAARDIETAIEIYKDAVKRYGTDGSKRWLPGHEVEELDPARLPFNFGRLPSRAR